MQTRYAVEFGEADARIEVVYWIDDKGDTTGEAYFRGHDMCADIKKGNFQHPFSGAQYHLFAPAPPLKSKDAVLQVLAWRTVGRGVPVKAEVAKC